MLDTHALCDVTIFHFNDVNLSNKTINNLIRFCFAESVIQSIPYFLEQRDIHVEAHVGTARRLRVAFFISTGM